VCNIWAGCEFPHFHIKALLEFAIAPVQTQQVEPNCGCHRPSSVVSGHPLPVVRVPLGEIESDDCLDDLGI
jgi:hypothetical protein